MDQNVNMEEEPSPEGSPAHASNHLNDAAMANHLTVPAAANLPQISAGSQANSPSNQQRLGLAGAMGHNVNPRGQSSGSSAANHSLSGPSNNPHMMRLGDDEDLFFPPLGGAEAGGLLFGANLSQHQSNPAQQQNQIPGNIVPYNWQACKTTVKERLSYMFNNDVMADVYFLVGKAPNVQRIPAHKFVLSIGSAVFDAMFNGGMATKSEEVEIPDVEASAFLALLKFLYSDEVQIDPETVMTTLYTAKKYAVPALERACVDFLKRNLSSDNAFMLLTQARLFDEPQLAALCLETIDKNTSEGLAAEGFTDIDLDTLCVVLERDTLGIRECKLFNAVCRWSEAECIRQGLTVNSTNQRSVLGRALQLVRFPLMTVEEFAVGAAQSGRSLVLITNEISNDRLIIMTMLQENNETIIKCDINFLFQECHLIK